METKLENLEDNKVKVDVVVYAKDVDQRIKKAYRDFAHRYSFPGFRRGKAPRPVIDNALGAQTVLASVTEDIVNEVFPQVLSDEQLYPVANADFDKDLMVENGKPFEFSFTLEVKPDLELNDYSPVAIELPISGATDKEIDEQIESLRTHYASYEDAPANTKMKAENAMDMALVVTNEEGEPIPGLTSDSRLYVPSTGLFSDAFEEKVMGMKKGQTEEFTLEIPEDEKAILFAGLAGKTANFKVTCNAVKKRELPELTDEWVKDAMGFENLEEMRQRVVDSIVAQKESVLPRMKENAVLAALEPRLVGDAPESMVKQAESDLLQDFLNQLQSQGANLDHWLTQQNLDFDQFKEDVHAQAHDTARQDLALDAYARHAGLTTDDEEIVEEFRNAGVEDPEKTAKEWRDSGRIQLIRQGIIRGKAVRELMDSAIVTEVDPEVLAEKNKAEKEAKKERQA